MQQITAAVATLMVSTAMNAKAYPPAQSQVVDSITHPLEEISVIAHRQPELNALTPQQVLSFSSEAIALANVQTTADLLSNSGMVAVQRSQQGGGSPMLRGFESNRVLLVIDGIRMNNLIYRSGHLQNIITVDQAMLESAEVLFGPSSVAYGSDALGGVMAFRTKQPKLLDSNSTSSQFCCETNAFMRYGSVNEETTGHVDFNIGGKKFASLTSFTYSDFGDLRCGRNDNPFMKDDEYIHRPYTVSHVDGKDVLTPNPEKYQYYQPGSGYHQYDILQKFLYRPNDRFSHTLNFQLSNSGNVPRYDRLTDMKKDKPKFAEWYYGPQFRLLTYYNTEATNWLGADKFSFTVAYQKVKESRNNRKLNDPWLGSRKESVDIVSLVSDWTKRLSADHSIHAGIDGSLNFLKSTAHKTNIDTDERKSLDTRYPDGDNYMHNIDAYVMHRWDISPRLSMSDGARVGYSTLHSTFHDTEFFPFLEKNVKEVSQNNLTYSLDLGLNYNPNNDWQLSASLSTGYYVPNIDDVGKVFDSQPGMVVVPNPDVRPEQAIGLDLGVTRMQTSRVLWQTNLFGSYLFDAITLMPHTLNGNDSIVYDNELSRVYANHNTKRAYILGANTHINVKIAHGLAADARITYTYGKIIDGEDKSMPLDHIAPLFGRIALTWQSRDQHTFAEFYSLFNGKKRLSTYNINGEDNIGYATVKGADGSGLPAWFTLNLKASHKLSSYVTIQLAAENLLDTQYRVFASGINAPGRNITTTLRCKF